MIKTGTWQQFVVSVATSQHR